MKKLLIVVWCGIALLMSGCGGGGAAGTEQSGTLQADPGPLVTANSSTNRPTIIAYSKSPSAGKDRGEDQYAVMRFTDATTTTVFYGTRFINGTPKTISQSITKMLGSRVRVRAYYDAGRRPVLLIDELTLNSLLIQYTPTSTRILVFDPSHRIIDFRRLNKIGGKWECQSIMDTLSVGQLYEARASKTVTTNGGSSNVYAQAIFSRSYNLATWTPDSRAAQPMSVEWPSGRDEAASSTESTIAIPYSSFLKMIVSPTVGRTVKPMLELTTVGESSIESRCALIDGIRASTALDRELVERFSQAISSYLLLDHYAAIDLVSNGGTTVEKAFSDEDWMLHDISVIGSYPIPYPTTNIFLLSNVSNFGHELYSAVASHTHPNVRLVPQYDGGTIFEGAYDDATDTLRGSMKVDNTTTLTDVVAQRFFATPVNQSAVPDLIQGRAVMMAFDLNNVGSFRPKTTSPVGSPDYNKEGLELWLMPKSYSQNFSYIVTPRANGANTAALGLIPGNQYFIWARTTSAATTMQSP